MMMMITSIFMFIHLDDVLSIRAICVEVKFCIVIGLKC